MLTKEVFSDCYGSSPVSRVVCYMNQLHACYATRYSWYPPVLDEALLDPGSAALSGVS